MWIPVIQSNKHPSNSTPPQSLTSQRTQPATTSTQTGKTKAVVLNLFEGQQGRSRHRQTYGHGERGGEGGVYGKSNMETYMTICKRDSQREFVRKLKQGLCINLGGGMVGRWEGGSRGRGYMYTCGWFMLRFERKQQNSVKQLSFNKKKI